jgi:hypothetical protein
MKANDWTGWLLVGVLLSAAMPEAVCDHKRWDNTVVVIDLVKAIRTGERRDGERGGQPPAS